MCLKTKRVMDAVAIVKATVRETALGVALTVALIPTFNVTGMEENVPC